MTCTPGRTYLSTINCLSSCQKKIHSYLCDLMLSNPGNPNRMISPIRLIPAGGSAGRPSVLGGTATSAGVTTGDSSPLVTGVAACTRLKIGRSPLKYAFAAYASLGLCLSYWIPAYAPAADATLPVSKTIFPKDFTDRPNIILFSGTQAAYCFRVIVEVYCCCCSCYRKQLMLLLSCRG